MLVGILSPTDHQRHFVWPRRGSRGYHKRADPIRNGFEAHGDPIFRVSFWSLQGEPSRKTCAKAIFIELVCMVTDNTLRPIGLFTMTLARMASMSSTPMHLIATSTSCFVNYNLPRRGTRRQEASTTLSVQCRAQSCTVPPSNSCTGWPAIIVAVLIPCTAAHSKAVLTL